MSKTINFHKNSNMAIEISQIYCVICKLSFFELDGHELDDCPKCGSSLAKCEPERMDSDHDTYLLIVDPVTGVPTVVRRDGKPMLDKGYEIKPGDIVDAINETQYPFLKGVLLYSIEHFRFGAYTHLRYEDELYTIPIERVVLAPKEGAE